MSGSTTEQQAIQLLKDTSYFHDASDVLLKDLAVRSKFRFLYFIREDLRKCVFTVECFDDIGY